MPEPTPLLGRSAIPARESRTDAYGEPIPTPPGPYDYWESRRLNALVVQAARRFGWAVYVVPDTGGNWEAHGFGVYWTTNGLGGSTSNGERLVPNPPEVPWTNEAAFFNPYGRAIKWAKERRALLKRHGCRRAA